MRKTTRMSDAITKTPTRANSKGETNDRKQGESKRNKSAGANTNYFEAFNSMFKTKETGEADEEDGDIEENVEERGLSLEEEDSKKPGADEEIQEGEVNQDGTAINKNDVYSKRVNSGLQEKLDASSSERDNREKTGKKRGKADSKPRNQAEKRETRSQGVAYLATKSILRGAEPSSVLSQSANSAGTGPTTKATASLSSSSVTGLKDDWKAIDRRYGDPEIYINSNGEPYLTDSVEKRGPENQVTTSLSASSSKSAKTKDTLPATSLRFKSPGATPRQASLTQHQVRIAKN